MNSTLEGLTAVVTGGAGQVAGLGQGLVRQFAGAGMRVAILDVDGDAAFRLASDLRGHGNDAIAFEGDVTATESLEAAAAAVDASFGACNILCAHVGGGGQGRFSDLPLQAWRQAMELMVVGTVSTIQSFLPLMRRTDGFRRIVLTSSIAALAPGRYQGPYRAAKAAVMSIGETLDLELAEEGIGTTVVFPSGMLTAELMDLGRGVIGTTSDPDNLEMAIAHEMITDVRDLAEGDDAARPVLEAVTAARPYVVTHGCTAEAAYAARHELIEQAFAELAARSYRPAGDDNRGS